MRNAARTVALLPVLGITVFALGCPRHTEGTASDASASAPSPAPATSAAHAADASAPPATKAAGVVADAGRGADKANATPLSAKARAEFFRELSAGRKLSLAKDWPGAIKALDRALALSPEEPRALSELGWAAFQAKDLARAEAANQRALANTKEPKLRAPALYNMGRVAEARGNKEAAKKAYADSLALRDNAEVKKRLEALGGGSAVASAAPEASGPCATAFPEFGALCACLRKNEQITPPDAKFVCAPATSVPALGEPRLGVVVWGAETLGEQAHLLTVKEGGGLRGVAELGRDYEPGAFGVHNTAQVLGGEKRTVSGHTIVVVRSEQDDNDSNRAGLELCIHHAKLETVCALGDGKTATRCAPPIPVEVESGCGPGVEPDNADLDEETRKEIAEIKKNQTKAHAKTKWTLSDDGKLTVTLTEGSRDLVDAQTLRPHALW